MNIEELISHTNIIIEEGLDSEDDIQLILQKWKTAYEKEKEKREKLEYEATEAEEYIKGLKEKNKSLEQENSFLKMMYRGTDEFKAIENLAKEE